MALLTRLEWPLERISEALRRFGEPVAPLPRLATRFARPQILGIVVITLAAIIWRAFQRYPTGVFDFYPLYYGAKAWLHNGNAYDLAPVVPASHHGYQLYEIGNIYPLPGAFLALPFSVFPPVVAGTLWMGIMTAGILIALRLNGWPLWFAATLPILEAVRIEQHTAVILLLQLLAIWAYRTGRLWTVALCCTLILTKPNQGLLFAVLLCLLSRSWRQFAVLTLGLWGGSFLLDPNWVAELWPQLVNQREMLQQPIFWPLAFLALPLFFTRNLISGVAVLQFAILPYAGIYAASAVPLGILDDRRSRWVCLLGVLWMFPAILLGQSWGLAIFVMLPVVALSALRWRERNAATTPAAPQNGTLVGTGAD